MGGFGYELLVIGLWFVITRGKGDVGVGRVVVIQLRQGRRKIFCLERGIEKKKDVSPSELWFTILGLGLILQKGHIHNQSTIFWLHDSRILILLFSKYQI